MLANSTSEDDHAGLFRLDRHIVQSPYIRYNVEDELRFSLVRVEIDHVSQRTVSQGWAKDWNIVLLSAAILRGIRLTNRKCVKRRKCLHTL